jgi:hypothetical protein
MDQLEVSSIGSNERCAVRSRSDGDQDIEVEISEFLRGKTMV